MISTHLNEETHREHFHIHRPANSWLIWMPDATARSDDIPTKPSPGYADFIRTSGFFVPFQRYDCVLVPSSYQGKDNKIRKLL